MSDMSGHESCLAELSAHWRFGSVQVIPGLVPAGSPERSARRLVFADAGGGRFVLEGVRSDRASFRGRQAQILQALADAGVAPLIPWMATPDGAWGVFADGLFWQLRRWLDSIELPREEYGRHAWRGDALADFLIRLQLGGELLPPALQGSVFSIVDYIEMLLPMIAVRNAALHTDLLPIWAQLEDFRAAHDQLPLAWNHGDLHPLNALWTEDGLNGIIDWEFTGLKAECYDLANLLGCLGMDNPEFLTGAMAEAVCTRLAKAGLLSAETWHWLPEYIAAQRFGWMREWCWRQRVDMMCQELDFIWLLLDNRDFLRQRWGAWRDRARRSPEEVTKR